MKNNVTFCLSLLLLVTGCEDVSGSTPDNTNYRMEMMNFVIGLSAYTRGIQNNFIIIPQNEGLNQL